MKSWVAIGVAVTFACGSVQADNITHVKVEESAVTGGHITATAVGDNGDPLPAGTPVEFTFKGPNGQAQTVNTTAGENGRVHVVVPTGYHSSTLYVQDGGQQSQPWSVKRHDYDQWGVIDPLQPFGTDTWTLAADSGRTYQIAELVGDVVETTDLDVLGVELNVQYGSGEGGVYDVTLDSGFLSLSDEHLLLCDPGLIGQIYADENTFELTLTGTFDADPWSMYWSGVYADGGAEPCPGSLFGSAYGICVAPAVPEPASVALLLLGISATAWCRRRFA